MATGTQVKAIPPDLPAPPKIAHVAAGLVFCRADALHAAPPDPHFHYHGEELSHSLRLWTRGYECFAIRQCIAHHAYNDKNERAPTDPNADVLRHWRSTQRISGLLGEPADGLSKVALEDLEQFCLGTVRTVASWEAEFGLSLSKRQIY